MTQLNRDTHNTLIARGIEASYIPDMTAIQILDEYLKWNGIIGYTDAIVRVLDNARIVENERKQSVDRIHKECDKG